MSCLAAAGADRKLIQIVDAALAEAARRSGEWLVCRPGCTQCCIGAFAISQLDALRLRQGLAVLETTDPERASRVRLRSAASLLRLAPDFPGDAATGILGQDEDSQTRFESFADEEVCPVLDPDTGTCDLYASRPMTCRVFGPPVRQGEEAVGVCELCYHGATEDQISACQVEPDPEGLEEAITAQLERDTGLTGQTVVAFALRD